MIQINNLVKKFDDFTALDGVNMNVEKGAVYGLVGPNGAGKSTLIRHITGVMRQDAGEVFIDGEPVYENARIKGHMAYIPDDMFYFLQSDTINMMHYYKGMYPGFDEKQFYRMQEFFPSIDVKRNIRKLSKGMQKQVAFWLALCCKPKLIVLDEPVDGLDPVMRRQIWSIMLDDVAANNTTVVVSSHNLRELEDSLRDYNVEHKVINYDEQTKHIAALSRDYELRYEEILLNFESAEKLRKSIEEQLEGLQTFHNNAQFIEKLHTIGSLYSRLSAAEAFQPTPTESGETLSDRPSIAASRSNTGDLRRKLAEETRKNGITKTALIVVGDFLGENYERSKLYDPAFTTEFRQGTEAGQ